MGVAVDKTGGDHVAFCVYHVVRRGADAPDGGNSAVLDPDVAAITRAAGAIDDHSVLNHQIKAHRNVSLF